MSEIKINFKIINIKKVKQKLLLMKLELGYLKI